MRRAEHQLTDQASSNDHASDLLWHVGRPRPLIEQRQEQFVGQHGDARPSSSSTWPGHLWRARWNHSGSRAGLLRLTRATQPTTCEAHRQSPVIYRRLNVAVPPDSDRENPYRVRTETSGKVMLCEG